MIIFSATKWLLALCLFSSVFCGQLTACQVPVFRYALERWESDTYQLVLVSPSTITEPNRKLVDHFKKSLGDTNLTFLEVDLSTSTEEELLTLPKIDRSVTTPQLFLFSPDQQNQPEPIAVKPLSEKSLSSIIDSPARRQIVKSLIEGQSCIWLVLHNGQADKARSLQTQLNEHLKVAESKITLPEGIIATDQRSQITQNTDLDDVLRSSIPLKIAFTSQVLDAQNAGEETLVATLLSGLPQNLRVLEQPLIFPIFGRGRKVSPITAAQLSYQTVLNGSHYLCGACSCQVKDQNPGSDLLIQENWESHLTEGLVVVEKELPPLSGIAEIITTPSTTEQKQRAPKVQKNNAQKEPQPKPAFLTIALIACVFFLVASAFILLKRNS